MLCVFGKGRLGMDPEQKMNNASGSYYKVRIAVNRMVKKNGQAEKETLWCSGLVHEGKISYQLDSLKKGAQVTFMANKGWVQQWTDKNGGQHADVDLGFLALIETTFEGEKKTEGQAAPVKPTHIRDHTLTRMPEPAQSTQALAQQTFPVVNQNVQQQTAQHQTAQQAPTTPQPTWDGEKWVTPPVAATAPAAPAQNNNALPF